MRTIWADRFSRQLTDATFVLDVRRPALPVRQHRQAEPGDVPGCVLLLSRAADAEAHAIENLLVKIGITYARIDADTADTHDMVVDLARGTIRLDGIWVKPTVTWVRHFSAQAITSAAGDVHKLFGQSSWRALAEQLSAVSPFAIGVERPGTLKQLTAAMSLGINVPRTVIASAARAGAEVGGFDRPLVKAIDEHFLETQPGLLTGVFPQLVDQAELQCSDGPAAPVIVQDYVDHDLELRVYFVLGEILAFAITKDAPDAPWTNPDQLDVRPVDAPGAVRLAATAMADALSFPYAAFDFLLSGQSVTFLEASQSGDWLWIERRIAGAPVTAAAVRMLSQLHHSAARVAGLPLPRLGVTSFLAGTSASRR